MIKKQQNLFRDLKTKMEDFEFEPIKSQTATF